MTYASIPRSASSFDGGDRTAAPARQTQPTLRVIVPATLVEELRANSLLSHLNKLWTWLRAQGAVRAQHSRQRMRVTETVSLGEKRFVAILQVDGERILIGGSPGNVSLLKQLKADESFGDVLHTRWPERESA